LSRCGLERALVQDRRLAGVQGRHVAGEADAARADHERRGLRARRSRRQPDGRSQRTAWAHLGYGSSRTDDGDQGAGTDGRDAHLRAAPHIGDRRPRFISHGVLALRRSAVASADEDHCVAQVGEGSSGGGVSVSRFRPHPRTTGRTALNLARMHELRGWPSASDEIRPGIGHAGSRVPALDGLRGLAILLVVVFHLVVGQLRPQTHPAVDVLGRALSFTWTGVDLFFVLSGFLIGGILLDHFHASNFLPVFYIRRTCRIWPIYIVLLSAYFLWTYLRPAAPAPWVASVIDGTKPPWWSYLLFVQNMYFAAERMGPRFLDVTWSLAVEEQF